MKNWETEHNYKTVEEAILGLSGQSSVQLLHPKYTAPTDIPGMKRAFRFVKRAIMTGVPIHIVGDYDVDGITSSAILYKAITTFMGKVSVDIPRRFSEGYGINNRIIDSLTSPSLIVAVDNGIAAIDEVAYAKSRGHWVVILDHHLPSEKLPEADCLVDPHVFAKENSFVDYCGAGLAFKLFELMCQDEELNAYAKINNATIAILKKEMLVLAGIGTVADLVPLIGDNRLIVINALSIMNQERSVCSQGLKEILEISLGKNENPITATSIAFKVAPMINSTSRLHDKGAIAVLKTVLCRDNVKAMKYAARMQEINEERRVLTEQWYEKISTRIPVDYKYPIIVYEEELPEGLCGIIAGRISEKFNVPAAVFTLSNKNGQIRGSARSKGNLHLKEMLDTMPELFLHYGGHKGAAGITFESMIYLKRFVKRVKEYCKNNAFDFSSKVLYDVVVDKNDVLKANEVLQKYEPYGMGVPKPVVRIDDFIATSNANGYHYMYLGSDKKHFKLFGKNYGVVGFNLADEFNHFNKPDTISIIGVIEQSYFRGKKYIQVRILDCNFGEEQLKMIS